MACMATGLEPPVSTGYDNFISAQMVSWTHFFDAAAVMVATTGATGLRSFLQEKKRLKASKETREIRRIVNLR